jgi:hypothetical protein
MIVVWLVVNDAKKLHHLFIALGNMAVAVKKSDRMTSYERFKLLADLRATSVIGFNKEPYKLYDHSIAFFDSNSHISLAVKKSDRMIVKFIGLFIKPNHAGRP